MNNFCELSQMRAELGQMQCKTQFRGQLRSQTEVGNEDFASRGKELGHVRPLPDEKEKISAKMCKILFDGSTGRNMLLSR
jgi:hypothetical protein